MSENVEFQVFLVTSQFLYAWSFTNIPKHQLIVDATQHVAETFPTVTPQLAKDITTIIQIWFEWHLTIDSSIRSLSNRRLSAIDPIELAILRTFYCFQLHGTIPPNLLMRHAKKAIHLLGFSSSQQFVYPILKKITEKFHIKTE